MPLIDFSEMGTPASIPEVSPGGVYHATAIALSPRVMKKAVRVDVSDIMILDAANQNVISTESIRSCFPAIFKFKRGDEYDIALYHGASSVIPNATKIDVKSRTMLHCLNRPDLIEIQIFVKEKPDNHLPKAIGFFESLITFFEERQSRLGLAPPQINTNQDSYPFGVVVCYKNQGVPVVVIGHSGGIDGAEIVTSIEQCVNKEVITQPHNMMPAKDKFHTPEQKQKQAAILKSYHQQVEQLIARGAAYSAAQLNLEPVATISTAPATAPSESVKKKKRPSSSGGCHVL